mgnify:CR=1 FL=1
MAGSGGNTKPGSGAGGGVTNKDIAHTVKLAESDDFQTFLDYAIERGLDRKTLAQRAAIEISLRNQPGTLRVLDRWGGRSRNWS